MRVCRVGSHRQRVFAHPGVGGVVPRQLAYNAVLAAMVAIIPDQIPSARRGTVVGILGVCMPVGQIVGTFLVQLLAGNLTLACSFGGDRARGRVGAGVCVADRVSTISRGSVSGTPAPSSRSSPSARRDFSWAWMSRVLFVMGSVISAGLPAVSADRRPWLRSGGGAAADLPVDPGAGGHDGGVESDRRAAVG